MIFVFFIYGLSFFVLGWSIFLYPKKGSIFKLAKNLRLIACFGVVHGINEWIDMFILIEKPAEAVFLKALGLPLLAVSYLFLVQFGVKTIIETKKKYSILKILPILLFVSWLAVTILSSQRFLLGDIFARYLLGIPGTCLTAYALFLQIPYVKKRNLLTIVGYIRLTAISYLFYGFFSGLIVPKAQFFPASSLNYTVFLDTVGISVQAFRSICAIVITYSMIRTLSIFEWETKAAIKDSEEKYRTLTETSPDCIKLFNLKGELVFINKGGMKEHRLKDMEEAKKWSLLDGIIEEDKDNFKNAFNEAVRGNISTVEIRHTEEGSVREECRETMAPVIGEDGRIEYIFGVSRDISDIKSLERTKDALCQMIVHDLNNPLNILLGGLQFLEGNIKDATEEQKNVIDISLAKVREMKLMTSNLLDISRIEEGKLTLNYEKVDIRALIKEIAASMNIVAHKQKKEITVKPALGLPQPNADKEILRRVILNLLGNALKFAPEDSIIEVSADYNKDKNFIIIGVKDKGAGIPLKYQRAIFDKFVQVTDPRLKGKGGKGLGLAFCKMAVEAHKGKIWVESGLGKGSTFYFTIPMR
ncbi:MAG: ATP-binding protein [Candidatus Omnitrophota bacterium]